jgi:hypothetical protein
MIGGEIPFASYLPEQKWRCATDEMFPAASGRVPVSFLSAVLLLSKAQISTDPFIIGATFKTGVIQALLIGLLIMGFTESSLFIFSRTWQYGRAYTYSDVWDVTFGPRFAWIPTLLLLLLYLSYNSVCAQEIVSLPRLFLTELWPQAPEIVRGQWFLQFAIGTILVLPFSMARRFVDLWPLAYVSTFALLTGLACLGIHLVRQIEDRGFDPDGTMTLFSGNFMDLLTCAKTFNVVFFIHPFLSFIFKDLDSASIARCMRCARCANILCLVLTYGGGLLTYFMFLGDLPTDENSFVFMDPKYPEIVIGHICSYIASVATLAYFCAYMARLLTFVLIGYDTDSLICNFIGVVVHFTCALMMTFAGSDGLKIIAAIGDCCSCILAFILPPVYFLVQYKFVQVGRAGLAGLVLIVGLVLGGLLLYLSMVNLGDSGSDA